MNKTLENWRLEIDALDEELLTILAKRMEIVRRIGKLKKENKIPLLDKKRWQEVLRSKLFQAKNLHLSKNLITQIYTVIHEYALQVEENIK